MLEKPICIIGAARSGTTLVGRLVSRHPDVVFWNEPKYIWRYRNPGVSHDRRTEAEATPRIRNYIRSRLERYVEENGASRLVEKTPSNCFRVPFVYAVLPEARFIHVVRDGRDAAVSAWKQWKVINDAVEDSSEERSTLRLLRHAWNRIYAGDVPVADLPFYALDFARSLVRSVGVESGSTDVNIWGPKFPGIQEVTQSSELLEVCAIQWRESVRAAKRGLASMPDEQRLDLRFEDLVQNPGDVMSTILDFAKLTAPEAVIEDARDYVRSDAAHRWHDRPVETVERIMAEVGPFIKNLEASQKGGVSCR